MALTCFDKFTPHPPHPQIIIIITIIIIIIIVVVVAVIIIIIIIILIIIIIIKLPLTGLSTVFVHALFRAILRYCGWKKFLLQWDCNDGLSSDPTTPA